jgi:predicted metal-binding membrane protein
MSEVRAGDSDPLAGLLRRDRAIILAALLVLTALSWLYLFRLAGRMTAMTMPMAGMAMTMPMPETATPWAAAELALRFTMWWVMMIGMMVPSAAPMILTFGAINQDKRGRGQPFVPTAAFAAGYLIVWGGFSLAATLVQAGLEQAAWMPPMTALASPLLAGVVLLAAGIYQLTPLKSVCLRNCRSPLNFVLNHWREGYGGAIRMGLAHGAYCLGCCWLLMALLFVGGVMNLVWVATIAGFVLLEKLLPLGRWIPRVSGAALVLFGCYLLTTA